MCVLVGSKQKQPLGSGSPHRHEWRNPLGHSLGGGSAGPWMGNGIFMTLPNSPLKGTFDLCLTPLRHSILGVADALGAWVLSGFDQAKFTLRMTPRAMLSQGH